MCVMQKIVNVNYFNMNCFNNYGQQEYKGLVTDSMNYC